MLSPPRADPRLAHIRPSCQCWVGPLRDRLAQSASTLTLSIQQAHPGWKGSTPGPGPADGKQRWRLPTSPGSVERQARLSADPDECYLPAWKLQVTCLGRSREKKKIPRPCPPLEKKKKIFFLGNKIQRHLFILFFSVIILKMKNS